MIGFELSDRDRMRLAAVVEAAASDTTASSWWVEGLRTPERQRELVAKGASQTQNSLDIKQADGWGRAVDLAPLVGGAITWSDQAAVRGLADIMKMCAAELGVPLEWGGDGKTLKDSTHFQLPRGWRGYAVAALAGGLVLGDAAWTAQGWRWDAKLARAEVKYAAVVMMPKEWPSLRPLMLLAFVLSATGCTPTQTRWLVPQSPEIPMLPTEARRGPAPSICLSTCSAGLAAELKRLQELQAVPARRTDWRAGLRRCLRALTG
ncbi:putative phage-related protein [Bordetella bronchiseptica MO211]|uniref:M15 family metallopeptidase n=1 Tax=Bordetella bronchiseptica TaxID=518 RepID=UPI000290386D|nr:putative phage-related protein [Bordetella bronchiseptica MO211]